MSAHVAELLTAIRAVDPSRDGTENAPDAPARYRQRAALIHRLIAAALDQGWAAGINAGEVEPGVMWPVAYVDLPTGQVSWHLAPYEPLWDGHTTDEKYRRCFDHVRTTKEATRG